VGDGCGARLCTGSTRWSKATGPALRTLASATTDVRGGEPSIVYCYVSGLGRPDPLRTGPAHHDLNWLALGVSEGPGRAAGRRPTLPGGVVAIRRR